MHTQFVNNQLKPIDHATGADFSVAIQAIQTVSKAELDLKKLSSAKLNESLINFVDKIKEEKKESFTPKELKHFLRKSDFLIQSFNLDRPPLGPALIYGSRSSPLLRFFPVLQALKSRCSVVLFCNPATASTYIDFLKILFESHIPPQCLALITTQDPEALETLVFHPSLKSIYFTGHEYEASFFKNLNLPFFQKRIKIHFGGKNPVVFSHDANLDLLEEMLKLSLDTSYLDEHRFHRWFVHDKAYNLFSEKLNSLYSNIIPTLNLSFSKDPLYLKSLELQNESLLKEKNWQSLSPPYIYTNHDFNNCSPWQQQDTLGPLLTITRYKTMSEAIKFANTTNFASACAVISADKNKSIEISNQLTMPHSFNNEVPDIGAIDAPLGLVGSGIGFAFSDEKFFTA